MTKTPLLAATLCVLSALTTAAGAADKQAVALPPVEARQVTDLYAASALQRNGVGVARRGPLVVLAGGRSCCKDYFTMQPSTQVELLDLRSGRVEILEHLPIVSRAIDLAWLDEDRVLAKGHSLLTELGPQDMAVEGLTGASVGMAVYSFSSRRWRSVAAPAIGGTVVGQQGPHVLVMNVYGRATEVDFTGEEPRLVPWPQGIAKRQGARTRWLDNGHLVRAGGMAQQDLVSLVDEACESTSSTQRCPVRYGATGAVEASRWHERVAGSNAAWMPSALSSGLGTSAVVDARGRVVVLGRMHRPDRPFDDDEIVIERSNPSGTAWDRLPLPQLPRDSGQTLSQLCPLDLAQCELLLAADPARPGQELLFLRASPLVSDRGLHDAMGQAAQTVSRIWWFDDETSRWQLVLELRGRAVRDSVQTLTLPLAGASRSLKSIGWHLDQPILWAP